jgi:hypothetical protein
MEGSLLEVRGLNAKEKWDSLRDKINECQCDIIGLQETKRDNFDSQYIKKFYPASFDTFEFLPSVGASGGVLTAWKSSHFNGSLAFSNEFGISVQLKSVHGISEWILTNIYGPFVSTAKNCFLRLA